MGFWQNAKGILGLNARNHLYISKYNSQASKHFADDKLYTKHFLESRGIGIAKTFRVIESLEELRHLSPTDLPESFVIKPNHGFGGEGIMVIIRHKDRVFSTISGRLLSFEEIFLHCAAILDGKFSISGLHDKVLIEERLEPHADFSQITASGLSDIRVIVFNLVPVVAMLRTPTPESEGKANVHLGGIGAGVDIGTGKTTYGVRYNKPLKKFSTGRSIRDFQIPFWDEVLLAAAKIQAATKIGFAAIDFVITPQGVKVLELNARAGLMVQIANRVMLRGRLEKVRDLKIPTPEKGVEVARTLFSVKILPAEKELEKIVIGKVEIVEFLSDPPVRIWAKIDPHATENSADPSLLTEKQPTADIVLAGKRLRLPFVATDRSTAPEKIVLAGKYLPDFLVDLTRSKPEQGNESQKRSDVKLLQNIDRKVVEIDSEIKLLSYFRPQNLEEQKESFLKNPVRSPQFFYKIPSLDFSELRRSLGKIPRQCDHPLMPLFIAKIGEIEKKLHLIEAVNTIKIQEYSEALWGEVDSRLCAQAVDFLHITRVEKDESPIMLFPEICKEIEAFLRKHNLKHWSIQVLDSTVADFQISKQNNHFLVKKGVNITENRLRSLLAHEVETHIYRLENGRRAPFHLFARGTAGYLKTEEGLASYNQSRVGVPIGEKILWGAHRVVAAFLGKTMSFVDLFHHLMKTFGLDQESAWRSCVKVKRGLQDTSLPFSFVKDALYFSGMLEVEEFLKKNPQRFGELYLGKIALADLEILKKWGEASWETSFLPERELV